MNIISFLVPKADVAYLRDNMSLRQGLEKLRRSGYTAIPVIDMEDRYVGVVSEGDFLWNILSHNENLDFITLKSLERSTVRDVIQGGKVKPACISTSMKVLLERVSNQNFVPVIDDRNVFIGIVRRGDVIRYFIEKTDTFDIPDKRSYNLKV